MGFFSRTKITYHTFSTTVLEDTPNYIGQSVLTSILNDRPITSDLRANIISSMGVKLGAYYRYGRDHYFYGLPQGFVRDRVPTSNAIRLVIESELGVPVLVRNSSYDPANAEDFALEHLVNVRGYDPDDESIVTPPAGADPGSYFLGSAEFTSSTDILIEYTTQGVLPDELTVSETIVVAPVLLQEQYFFVVYDLLDAEGEVTGIPQYWSYAPVTNVYETLRVEEYEDSPYMPVVPLRLNKVDLTIEPEETDPVEDQERYQTSKRLMSRLGLKIKDIGEAIHENPDISDINHGYLVVGATLQEHNQAIDDYLFRFFKYMGNVSSYASEVDYEEWLAKSEVYQAANPPQHNSVIIQEETYRIDLGWIYIKSQFVTGNLTELKGPVGEEVEVNSKVGTVQTETILRSRLSFFFFKMERSSYILRKQVTPTEYEEIEVYGLKHINYVYGNNTIDTSLKDTIEAAENDEEQDNFIIPIHVGIFNEMKMKDKIELSYHSIRLVFNARIKTRVKWYQTDFFKALITIVAIVITIYSLGTMGPAVWSTAGAILGTVGVTSIVLQTILTGILIYANQAFITFIVDIIGIEAALVLILLTAAYSIPGLQDARTWSTLQSNIITGISVKFDKTIQEIQNDWDALKEELDSAWNDLMELEKEIAFDALLDPMTMFNRNPSGLALPHETPEVYYFTRIHSGNLSDMDYAMITNYVRTMTSLEGVTPHSGLRI